MNINFKNKSSEINDQHYFFKNNIIIIILAIKLLNTILKTVFNDKISP
jgi:hypothetical protein